MTKGKSGGYGGFQNSGLRTWIEVDRDAIRFNYRIFRSLISKKTRLMAVVKSNAYGHDMLQFAKEVEGLGADFIGVDSLVEGVTLRNAGVRVPILVLGYTMPERLHEASQYDISVSLSTMEHLKALIRTKLEKPLSIHLKVDTGMHRQGFLSSDIPRVITVLRSPSFKKRARLEGLFTHFASAKNPAFPAYTKLQLTEFARWRDALTRAGFSFLSHASATGGTLLFPEAHFDMVRVGIGLYGLWPSVETESFLRDKLTFKPALVWKTVISEFKTLSAGSKVGYDCTETLEKKSVVAVCPVGYWHGFSRKLSSIARVLVRGVPCRVVGRVSMDMISIDISSVPNPHVADEVILIGTSATRSVTAEDMARLDETSVYETITRINPLIRRIYR